VEWRQSLKTPEKGVGCHTEAPELQIPPTLCTFAERRFTLVSFASLWRALVMGATNSGKPALYLQRRHV